MRNTDNKFQQLDFQILVFRQIERINMAETENNALVFFSAIETLENMLDAYARNNDIYQKEKIAIHKEMEERYKNAIKPSDKEALRMIEYKKRYRALMMLLLEMNLTVGEDVVYEQM